MRGPFRIEGYAIASADGMIADATGFMPDSLKFEADQRFFLEALDRAAMVAHGRLSHDGQPDSHMRRRLILTRRAPDLAPDPDSLNTWLWNPAGATLEEACAAAGCEAGTMVIAGGTEVFSLFLKIGYDDFYLARAVEVATAWRRSGLLPRPVRPVAGGRASRRRFEAGRNSAGSTTRCRSSNGPPDSGKPGRAPGDRRSNCGQLPSTRPY